MLLTFSVHDEDNDEYNTMVVKEDDNDSEVSCSFSLDLVSSVCLVKHTKEDSNELIQGCEQLDVRLLVDETQALKHKNIDLK